MTKCAEASAVEDPRVSAGCGPLLPLLGSDARSLRQKIYEVIRARGRFARSDIAKELDVSPGSVSLLSQELIAAGLVREIAGTDGVPGRGRPPVALTIQEDALCVIGMKLGDFSHSAVVVTASGQVAAEIDLDATPARRSQADLLDATERLLDAVLAKAGRGRQQVAGVGIGLAGMVDHRDGLVLWSPLLQMRDLALRDLAQARLGLPVYVDNDANMLTLAELWFGAGRARSSFAVVTIESGVGMGFVRQNRLYRGETRLGLELGHTKVQLDGALCRCGARGCLEAYVADYALIREARVALDLDNAATATIPGLLETLYDHAKAGNERARTIFRRAGRYLAVGLSNIEHLFDPELIILSGAWLRYDYLYAEEVLAEMRQLSLDKGARAPLQVETHQWGGYVWARGAAALALSEVTDEVFARRFAA